jgi:hypothetical protein
VKTLTNQTKGRMLISHPVLARLGAAVLVFGALALTAPVALACPCGSTQPTATSDTCTGLNPCYGSAPCSRVVASRPLWCTYVNCGACLTSDWWNQGGVLVNETIYDSTSNFCSQSCQCGPSSRYVTGVTVYETTYADPNCPPHS